jgi:ABC-2 type transport system ATP-binding protein
LSTGVVPQELVIDPYFTPRETLNSQAGYYGIKKPDFIADKLLEKLKLKDKANAYVRNLSGGMKRRLMIAKAMVHSPQILILDEPTAGVDVGLRNLLWENIRELNKKGTTVLITTHYLEEAEKLCDQIAIINKGKLLVSKTKKDLLKIIDTKEIHIQLKQSLNKVPTDLLPYLLKHNKDSLILRYKKNMTSTGTIIDIIMKNKLNILELTTRETDLEEIFLKLLKFK